MTNTINSNDIKIKKCSFCGNDTLFADLTPKTLLDGKTFYMCSECEALALELFAEQCEPILYEDEEISSYKPDLTIQDYKKELDQYVVGQEKAKILLAVAIYEHIKKIKYPELLGNSLSVNGNILIIGPTGCGKSYLAKRLSQILSVPYSHETMPNYTAAGYQGDSIEDIIRHVYIAANKNIEDAEHAIVFLDEIDKIKKSVGGSGPDVGGEDVQNALLTLIEGTTINLKVKNESGAEINVPIKTNNMLFIASGAFSGITDLLPPEKRADREKTIGFGSGQTSKKNINPDTIYESITTTELIKYGMQPELIGRLQSVVPVSNLTHSQLIDILKDTKDNVLCQYIKSFKIEGIDLVFDESCYDHIANIAIKNKTGARALAGAVQEIITKLMIDAFADKTIKKCIITKDSVLGICPPTIIRE